MDNTDLDRRLVKLESEQERMEKAMNQLILSTTRMGDMLELQRASLPKIERLNEEIMEMKLEHSNTKLVQKGFLWLAGIVGSSAVTIAMAFIFGGQ